MWVTPLLFIFIPFPLLYIKRVGRKGFVTVLLIRIGAKN